MRTKIYITGQISGNHKLYNKLGSNGLLSKSKGLFNSIIIEYESKKDAQKALSVAYQGLIMDEPQEKNKIGGINYLRGHSLSYDASVATILKQFIFLV